MLMVFPKSLPTKKNDSSINLSIVSNNFIALPLAIIPHFFGTVMDYCGHPSTPTETIPILLTKN
jgi:hypothetical protein